MGGTRRPVGHPWPLANDLHRPSENYFNKIQAQKNITRATYQTPLHPQFQPDFRHLPSSNVSSERDVRNFGFVPGCIASPETNSISLVQASQEQVHLEPFVSYPYFDGSSSSAFLSSQYPVPPQDIHVVSDSSPRYGSSFNHSSHQTYFMQQYQRPNILPGGAYPVPYHIVSAPNLHPVSFHPFMYNYHHKSPHVNLQHGASEVGYSITNGYVPLSDSLRMENSQTESRLKHTRDTNGHTVSSHAICPHVPHNGVQESFNPSTPVHVNYLSLSHPELHDEKHHLIQPVLPVDQKMSVIEEAAHTFVTSCCPLLGEKPYCLPPVKRSHHPDKSIKQLAVGMESEKRVFGSFERFFAEHQIPVFMLCHYPTSGFMQVYKQTTDKDPKVLHTKSGRDTLTLLLLSDVFSVTIVTVSIISGSSDFVYMQKAVQKSVAHIRRCSITVTKWLTFLGVAPEVRQVIAFPNLKRSLLLKITKDKQFHLNCGSSLSSLHMDDLSAPFEEEWSAPVHKHRFSQWMHEKILCHSPSLSRKELHLVVGALLSPRLSKVDFIQDQKVILPISESSGYSDAADASIEHVSKLTLSIDGVTKPFDEFMDEYVQCYYPDIEKVTYRVPPIHFNIQSLKKPTEYIQLAKDGSLSVSVSLVSEEDKSKNSSTTDSKTSLAENSINEKNSRSHPGETNNDVINGFMPSCFSLTETAKQIMDQISDADLQNVEALSSVLDLQTIDGYIQGSSIEQFSVSAQKIKNKDVNQDLSKVKTQNQTSASVVQLNKNPRTKSFVTTPRSSPSFFIASSSHSAAGSEHNVLAEQPSQTRSEVDARLEALQDVDVLSEVMSKDVRADEGENRVIGAFEKLGHHFGPMFIICDYQYNNYLNKLREEMFAKRETYRPIRAFGQTMRAQHDCLIVHKKYGVIVVSIKAIGDNFSDWGASEEQKINSTNTILGKAVKQLEREEAMIRHVTSDLHSGLSCHKLIALPNMTRESVEKALETDSKLMQNIKESLGHGVEYFLCADELPSKFQSVWDPQGQSLWNKLVNWWQLIEKLLMTRAAAELTSKVYRQIIGRYCGLLSTVEVWSPTNPRVEVRNMSEAVSVCAERFCKLVLLPSQLEAVCSADRRMFLYGPPGCGKTLVLTLKAREWLLAGETVVLVNSRPGSLQGYPYAYGVFKRLQQMMLQSKVQNYNLFMIRIDSLRFRAHDLAGIMPSCCIIMDEVTPACHDIIEHLCCLQVKYIWCAGLFEDDRPVTARRFTNHKMDKIIRCPPVIQSIMKHTEKEVKVTTPYKDIYQSSGKCSLLLRSSSISSDSSSDKENRRNSVSDSNCQKEKVLDQSLSYGAKNNLVDGKLSVKVKSSTNVAGDFQIEELHSKQNGFPRKQSVEIPECEKTENIKYDPDSLNKRLEEKYCKTVQKSEEPQEASRVMTFDPSYYCTSSAEIGLPTDGPRPHIIDHSTHLQAGSPKDCFKCGEKVAQFLETIVRPEGMLSAPSRGQQQGQGKNKHAFKTTGFSGSRTRSTKADDSNIFSVTSAQTKLSTVGSGQKPSSFTDSRALRWSDVLIVAKEMSKNCAFVAAIRGRRIPVEVVMGGRTFHIEDTKERKLFITQYKEVTGLERAAIVFVPDKTPHLPHQNVNTADVLDLHLENSLSRFTDEDRMVLWHVASRSLASLVLILP